jgi:hypothetical protein
MPRGGASPPSFSSTDWDKARQQTERQYRQQQQQHDQQQQQQRQQQQQQQDDISLERTISTQALHSETVTWSRRLKQSNDHRENLIKGNERMVALIQGFRDKHPTRTTSGGGVPPLSSASSSSHIPPTSPLPTPPPSSNLAREIVERLTTDECVSVLSISNALSSMINNPAPGEETDEQLLTTLGDAFQRLGQQLYDDLGRMTIKREEEVERLVDKKEVDFLTTRLQEIDTLNRTLITQKVDLEEQLNSMKCDHLELELKLQDDKSKYGRVVDSLASKIHGLADSVHQVNGRLKGVCGRITGFDQSITQIIDGGRDNAIQTKLADEQLKLQQMTYKHQQTIALVQSQAEVVEGLRASLQREREDKDRVDALNVELEIEVNTRKAELAVTRIEVAAAGSTTNADAKMRSELKLSETKVLDLQFDNKKINAILEGEKVVNDKVRSEVKTLQDGQDGGMSNYAEFQAKLRTLETGFEIEMREEKRERREEVGILKDEIQRSVKRNNDFETSILSKSKYIIKLQREIADLQEMVSISQKYSSFEGGNEQQITPTKSSSGTSVTVSPTLSSSSSSMSPTIFSSPFTPSSFSSSPSPESIASMNRLFETELSAVKDRAEGEKNRLIQKNSDIVTIVWQLREELRGVEKEEEGIGGDGSLACSSVERRGEDDDQSGVEGSEGGGMVDNRFFNDSSTILSHLTLVNETIQQLDQLDAEYDKELLVKKEE